MAILSVNAGSSSLKFCVYGLTDQGQVGAVRLVGTFEGLEPQGQARLRWCQDAETQAEDLGSGGADAFGHALERLTTLLRECVSEPLQAVAHRVVHGGAHFTRPVRVSPEVLAELAALNSLAPLHQPHNLAGIQAFARAFPALPQIACFDTAFHAGQPPLEQRFALPAALHAQGVRRYGFHGLSYQFILQTLQQHTARANGRVLMAHLGNGASLCGALAGHSVTSTMGFSALDGLMMGTRCGALDPGVLLHLLAQGWDRARLEHLLYKESGLLGVSGISADMRRLRADGSPAAQEAVALFTQRVVRESGAVAAVLQGLDVLAFSGGIGEHDAELRQAVGDRLGWLGVRIDPTLNSAATGDRVAAIQRPDSAVQVWVVPTDEGRVAAQAAAEWLAAEAAAPDPAAPAMPA